MVSVQLTLLKLSGFFYLFGGPMPLGSPSRGERTHHPTFTFTIRCWRVFWRKKVTDYSAPSLCTEISDSTSRL